MNENNFWDKFEEIEIIKEEEYGDLLQAKNKNTQKYIIIKRIDKSKYTNEYLSEINIMNKLKCENSISLIESFDSKDYYYIITDYYLMDLKEYMNKRNEGLSIEEIKEILIQLNNIFINNIDEINLNLSNIIICLDKLNKTTFKLTNYKLIKNNLLYTPPEILENKLIDKTKINIWELGIIIYYLLFKEFPYNGNNNNEILNDIKSNKKLKLSNNEELNDLLLKMLKINNNDRINWNEYFNHNFFNYNPIQFNYICNLHSKQINYYCKNCKKNICNDCINIHSSHQYIHFSKIGLNNKELNELEKIYLEIENNLTKFNKIKNDIKNIMNKIKTEENKNIYEDDIINNFKRYYINNLNLMKENISLENINLIDLTSSQINTSISSINNNNYILCEYDL